MKQVIQYIHEHEQASVLYSELKEKYGIYESHPLIQLSMVAAITNEVPEVAHVFQNFFVKH